LPWGGYFSFGEFKIDATMTRITASTTKYSIDITPFRKVLTAFWLNLKIIAAVDFKACRDSLLS
jgi:hypothetical protein